MQRLSLWPAAWTAAAWLLSAGALSAQYPFTVSGTGCAGFSGTPASISGAGFPTVGGAGYTITVSGPPSTATLVAIGTGPIPPFDLTGVGLPGCFLYLLPLGNPIANVTDANGDAVYSAPAPTLAGANVFLQGYVADVGPGTLGSTTELLSYTTLPASSSAGGELIVNEFMSDSQTIPDADGEWIEVFNTTASPIDIEGWYLADDDFDIHLIDTGGAGVVVPAGGYAVLGPNADPLVNGGITIAYEWSDYFVANTEDEIRLLDPVGFEIDRVAYASGWPLQVGKSASLDPDFQTAAGNDDPANWCVETAIYDTVALVNAGTPGVANNDCPKGPEVELGEIIVTEVMQNPAALSDATGEYFEVYNTTGAPIDLLGWEISDLGTDSHVIGSSVIVPAGGFATLAITATPGFTPDYVFSGISLANADDELVLRDALGALQDQILWDGGPSWPDPNGASMNFDALASQDATANNDAANWCTATVAGPGFTSGDAGSPGSANETCP